VRRCVPSSSLLLLLILLPKLQLQRVVSGARTTLGG
jgi:hypothetical protein